MTETLLETPIPPGEAAAAEAGTTRKMTLNMGPQHPSTHGVLRVLLELEGETILRAQPEIGYLHTGIEKEFEVKQYHQGTPLTDRVDYLSNLNNNLCYALAVEKLLQVEIPMRAQFTRVLMCELQRISSHLVWLGTHVLDLGGMSLFFYCMREREEILKIFEMFSGQRMMTSYIRIGGLALDHPRGGLDAVRRFVSDFAKRVDGYEDLLNANPIFRNRTQGVAWVSVDDLLDLGATGPMLRAAGLAWDIRKSEPYSSYDKFTFAVPIEQEGDVWARYRVRMNEMRESAKIIQQALDGMPEGPVKADAPKVVLPEREKMKTQMEALIYHFKLVTEGFAPPRGEAYAAVESPRGELGYYIVSDGGAKPYRVHMRTPSFANLQALPAMIEGGLISDSIAAMGSMDFVLGDVDR
jgi:NADH-quinone oxidoreductase subunit D